MKSLTWCCLLALAGALTPAFAQDSSGKLNQHYWIQLGAFHPGIDSHAQADHPQSGKEGTYLDFENELGLGYRYDDYKIKVSRADLTGKVEYRFSGPQLVLDAGF